MTDPETEYVVERAPSMENQPALFFTKHVGCEEEGAPFWASPYPWRFCPACGKERSEKDTTYVGVAKILKRPNSPAKVVDGDDE